MCEKENRKKIKMIRSGEPARKDYLWNFWTSLSVNLAGMPFQIWCSTSLFLMRQGFWLPSCIRRHSTICVGHKCHSSWQIWRIVSFILVSFTTSPVIFDFAIFVFWFDAINNEVKLASVCILACFWRIQTNNTLIINISWYKYL